MYRCSAAIALMVAVCLLTGCAAMSIIAERQPPGQGIAAHAATPEPQPTALAEALTPAPTPAVTPTPEPTPPPTPTPAPADVRLLMIGDTPAGLADVLAAVNDRMVMYANARILPDIVGWSAWSEQYGARVAAGAFDLCYVSAWSGYAGYAMSGALMPLDGVLYEHAPALTNAVGESALDSARVGGMLYAVPRADMPFGGQGVLYRDDIREELGLEPPRTLEALEEYLMAVKARGGITPYMASAPADAPLALLAGVNGWAKSDAGALIFTRMGGDGMYFDAAYSERFRAYVDIMARWQSEGLIKASSRSGRSQARYAYELGESAMCIAPMSDVAAIASRAAEHGQARSAYLHESEFSGMAYAGAFREGVALSARCAQPERVLGALEFMLTDGAVYDLMHYGIANVHYTPTASGAVSRDARNAFGLASGFLNAGAVYRPLAGVEWIMGVRQAAAARMTPVSSLPQGPGGLDAETVRLMAEADARFTALFYGKGDIDQQWAALIQAHDELGVWRMLSAE